MIETLTIRKQPFSLLNAKLIFYRAKYFEVLCHLMEVFFVEVHPILWVVNNKYVCLNNRLTSKVEQSQILKEFSFNLISSSWDVKQICCESIYFCYIRLINFNLLFQIISTNSEWNTEFLAIYSNDGNVMHVFRKKAFNFFNSLSDWWNWFRNANYRLEILNL